MSQTLVAHWNGLVWLTVTSANTGGNDYDQLLDVTCASTNDCWAVGLANATTLTEHWDGNAWTIIGSPNPSSQNEFQAVTCISGSQCWAVGYYNSTGSTVYRTLAEYWNGNSWQIIGSANRDDGFQNNVLYGVACPSPSDCWTVGQHASSTLLMHWDGLGWSIVTASVPDDAQSATLTTITCNSSSDCWAAGAYSDATTTRPLTVHWDGQAWSIAPAESPPSARNLALNGVTCSSSSDCRAVGSYYDPNAGFVRTLIEQWNGLSWNVVDSPNASTTRSNILYAVTCASVLQCSAVGTYQNGIAPFQPLIENWDGSSWSITSTPNGNPNFEGYLFGLTCTSASDCWTVGYYRYNNVNNSQQPLIEHWNGIQWTTLPSPIVPSMSVASLNATACSSSSNCWAVGYDTPTPGDYEPLIQQWDGRSWSIFSTSSTPGVLNSAACTSDRTCWAVGFTYNGTSNHQTLIELYTPAAPSPTPTPTPSPSPTPTPTATPTPVPAVAAPVITPNGGTFKKRVDVSISCATSGATIYYTTDGSDPTNTSTVYTNPFTITGKGLHTLKAKAVESGYTDSGIASATFTIK